jgi:hypothetical protein
LFTAAGAATDCSFSASSLLFLHSSMADIEALISETIEILGPLIAKPKMSDKYLRKPPFRYLHDIVVALVESHQFPKRLSAQDLDHNNFTEKVCISALLL